MQTRIRRTHFATARSTWQQDLCALVAMHCACVVFVLSNGKVEIAGLRRNVRKARVLRTELLKVLFPVRKAFLTTSERNVGMQQVIAEMQLAVVRRHKPELLKSYLARRAA